MPGLGTSVGRGGATTAQQSLADSDAILIMGSSMAEQHPVGFQWVMEARERGCKVIHVDPRFTRTSASADIWVPLRAGTDILFLGALIRYVIENDKWFKEYVLHYTNASTILREDFRDSEDGAGLFSGWDAEKKQYEPETWLYEGSQPKKEGGHAGTSIPPAAAMPRIEAAKPGTRTNSNTDDTLQHPRCIFQVLRRHFARYTPEMVERYCGVPQKVFLEVAETWSNASGPDKTACICYAVGWTQHSTGVQIIRAAAILQLLLGNIGRPGRRHSRAARARVDSGLDRHSHALRHSARLHAHAVLRGRCQDPREVHQEAFDRGGPVDEVRCVLHQLDARLVR